MASNDAELADAAEDSIEQINATDDAETSQSSVDSKLTLEERKKKMEQLRSKMRSSAQANRASVLEESTKSKISVKEAARLDRQRKLAEILRQKVDAEERGEDVERHKNWEYTVEENDEWEKKQARKARRADFQFHNDSHAARRKYKKDLDHLTPDLIAYNRQKEIAMGLAPGTLVRQSNAEGSSSLQVMPTSEQQRLAAESLYRDANTLLYADNTPTEDAIDRVVAKINKDVDKKKNFSRKRTREDEGDITYINEQNRVFNKKIARYYDKYTTEIRASFERGTAL